MWEYPSPLELDRQTADKLVLRFVDADGNPASGLWVNLIPQNSGSPLYERQIVPGYTDGEGAVYWTHYESGSFEMVALLEQEKQTLWDGYQVEITGERKEYEFVWNPREAA